MPHDSVWCDGVTFGDVADEFDDSVDLFFGEGLVAPITIARVSAIDDFDADRARVEFGLAKPAAAPGMPSQATFVDQAVDGGRLHINEVMAADPASCENLQRIGKIQVGVVQHDEARTTLMIEALISCVDPRFVEGCNTT